MARPKTENLTPLELEIMHGKRAAAKDAQP